MSVGHYENFPVASMLLPASMRRPIAVIYRFARSADDIADEGEDSDEVRLAGLNGYRSQLRQLASGKPPDAAPAARLFLDLDAVIRAYRLPIGLFEDLLDAFAQDVVHKRYADFEELLDYCRRSANPVGRLLLHLYGEASELNLRESDAICSSLQLVNFWQDVGIDWSKQRIYLPLDSRMRFGIAEEHIARREATAPFRDLMAFEVGRARALMLTGAPLAKRLPGRLGWELRLVIQGGLRIMERIEAAGFDVFNRRPVLRRSDWLVMTWRAMTM